MIDFDQGIAMLQRYELPEQRIEHCRGVAAFAGDLASRIHRRHPELHLDIQAIRLAALLHDIGRARPGDHELNSRDILLEEGLDNLAAMVIHGTAYEKYRVRGENRPELIPSTLENSIVAYADARFRLGPVTMSERLADIRHRRGPESEKMASVAMALPRLEAQQRELLALAGLPDPESQTVKTGSINAMIAAWIEDNAVTVRERPLPRLGPDDVCIRVSLAGICNTDHEILRGYAPGGIPGHEFIGFVEQSPNAALIGRKVTAEINCACGACAWCARDLGRHCPDRTVMGILGRDGALAQYVAAPLANIRVIPDWMSDTRAIFIEPLAAALEILEQTPIDREERALLLGDGKLAQLIAIVLQSTGCDVTMVGKHESKLARARALGARAIKAHAFEPAPSFDIVIEATGNAEAFAAAAASVRPRGRIVLKSTYAGSLTLDASRLVVNEITVIGSRCGRFDHAIEFMHAHNPPLETLIDATYDLREIEQAFAHSARSDSFKVLVSMP
jgi:putative nucleotidyltransferase with HDIG domain